MGITNDRERDFTKQSGFKRSGRIDLTLFQNSDDVGDGFPGLQKMIRNWVKYYLENGVMENQINMNNKDIDNLKDIDGNVIFVSTATELQEAIDNIGANAGLIILQSGTFTLTATIDIDQAGSYIIQGQGDKTIIDCAGNRIAFNITSAESCVLRDFKILCNDITGTNPAIDINEGSDNRIIVDNVTIDGTGNGQDAYGIKIQSDNCIVKNSRILEIRMGFEISGNNNLIIGNYIHSLNSPSATTIISKAIDISGIKNRIISNSIYNIRTGSSYLVSGNAYGIYNIGIDNIISNNNISTVIGGDGPALGTGAGGSAYAIYNTGTNITITSNYINTITGGRGFEDDVATIGCGIYNAGANSIIANNNISTVTGGRAYTADGNAYGIYNSGTYTNISTNNIDTVTGGRRDTDYGTAGYGCGIYNAGANSNITSNNISTVTGGVFGGTGGYSYGIYNNGVDYINTSYNNITTITGGNGDATGGNAYGILYNDSLYGTVEGNIGTDIDAGVGGAPDNFGIADSGTSNYNIWLGNNFNGETEDVTGANNIEDHNLT